MKTNHWGKEHKSVMRVNECFIVYKPSDSWKYIDEIKLIWVKG